MSERKVLNKYYPPDFDPTKIPRSKVPRSDTFAIRVMAPFNMRCNNCGEYIYKGKKFNSRKETVQDEFYLGLRIFRFYIKCPRCVSEIAFKTDLENTDYTLEAGATRNFEAQRTAEMLAKKEMEEKEEEDKNNPMKVLENRTKASRDEMTMLETLEDLKEMNAKNSQLDTERMVEKYRIYEQELQRLQDEEDEKVIRSIFSKTEDGGSVKRLLDDDDNGATKQPPLKFAKPTDFLVDDASVPKTKKYNLKAMKKNKPKALRGLVVKRKPAQAETHQQDSQQTQPAVTTATTTSLSDKSAASETTRNDNSVQDESITSNISSSSSAEHGSDSDNSALKTSDTSATASTSATTISNASADSTSAVAKSSATSTGSTTASASIGLGSSGLGLLGDYASSSSDDSD